MNSQDGMYGLRTLLVATLGMILLFVAAIVVGKDSYAAFATSVAAIVASVAVRSGVQSLAEGAGVKGAWTTLTTPAKPGEGPPP